MQARKSMIALHPQTRRNYPLSDSPSDMRSGMLSHSLADDGKADADR